MKAEAIEIKPCAIKGKIIANASKSYLQRALVLAMLADGKSCLLNCDSSADVMAVRDSIETLGAKTKGNKTLFVLPAVFDIENEVAINIRESGLALRMLAPVVSLFNKSVTINGEGSILQRPLQPLLNALTEAGIDFETKQNNLPLKIKSHIKNNKIHIDGSLSSQILTGFLITLPLLSYDTEIYINKVVSRPYIDMTLEVIGSFGVNTEHTSYERFYIRGKQHYKAARYEIEGDWSGSATFLTAAAISGKITVENLKPDSKQADASILEILHHFGAHITCGRKNVYVEKNICKPFHADITDCPDLYPLLCVLAAAAEGTSVIYGADRLRYKESDRVKTTIETMTKLGANIKHDDNKTEIYGKGKLTGGIVDSCNDHRIAFAASAAATISQNTVTITNPHVVSKSFPDFFEKFFECTNH